MRRILIYILLMIFLCFLIPIIFTHKNEIINVINEKEELKENSYNYGDLNQVRLLHSKTGEVEGLDLDSYLLGVVSSEMPADFEIEALKAQAVVARTYTIYKIKNGSKHEKADICDDPSCCQAWISKEDRFLKWNEDEREKNWRKIKEAVDSTKGKIIVYQGEPINAFFHSNSGGITDIASNVWGGSNYPYLQAVATSGEDAYSQYKSEVVLTKDEFISKIKEYHSDFEIDFNLEKHIEITDYTEGERIKTIKIGNLNLSGVEVRNIFKLKSAKFKILEDDKNIKFEVIRIWTWSWNEPNRSR